MSLEKRPQNFSSGSEIQLNTARMDYTSLRDLLAAGKWKEADYLTTRVMLQVAGKAHKFHLTEEDIDNFPFDLRTIHLGSFTEEDIDNFPSEDLRTIDQLWVKYSNGRFGFSVQKRIYQSLGGTSKYDEKIWEAFCNQVNWPKYPYLNQNILFTISAPVGHLPISHRNILEELGDDYGGALGYDTSLDENGNYVGDYLMSEGRIELFSRLDLF